MHSLKAITLTQHIQRDGQTAGHPRAALCVSSRELKINDDEQQTNTPLLTYTLPLHENQPAVSCMCVCVCARVCECDKTCVSCS